MGLLPMADLVLRFSAVDESRRKDLATELRLPRGVEQIASVAAERVPSGGVGGRSGYLFRDPRTARVEFKVKRA